MSASENLNRHHSGTLDETAAMTGGRLVPLLKPIRKISQMVALSCCCGLLSGIAGMSLALTLHWVQHVAYGYSLDAVMGSESFLQGVSNAPPLHRFLVLLACGLVAGLGWCGLARFGRHLVSVRAATERSAMPVIETVLDAFLQVGTVALGSPLGREVAPREIGTLLSQSLLGYVNLTAGEYRLLLSCGAGAGLAAVYDVPIAATVFILEVMMRQVRFSFFWPAVVASFTAATVARSGLGGELQYTVPPYPVTTTLMVTSLAIGPFFGGLGLIFRRVLDKVSANAVPSLWGVVRSVGAFAIIGAFATNYPTVLGNGKGPAELAFTQHIVPLAALCLLGIKIAAIVLSLRVGAKGGLLTPGLAVGALVGLLLGNVLETWIPGIHPGAIALVGATAFLSSSMVMPLTAVCLVMEFTDAPIALVLPVALATAGAELARRWLDRLANPTQTIAVAS